MMVHIKVHLQWCYVWLPLHGNRICVLGHICLCGKVKTQLLKHQHMTLHCFNIFKRKNSAVLQIHANIWLCFSLAGRKNSIANEWKFSTKAELLAGDVKLSAILQESPTLRKCCLKSAYAGHLKLSSTNQSSGREIPSPNHLRHWRCKWRNSRMICKSFPRNYNKSS